MCGPPGYGKPEQLRALVEGLAGGVVHGPAEALVTAHLGHVHDLGVPAGDHQHRRRQHQFGGERVGQDVALDVVHAHQRQVGRAASALAVDRPTSSAPSRPGPAVTATPSRSRSSSSRRCSSRSTSGSRFTRCAREASSGTTPPKTPCRSAWDDTRFSTTPPSLSYRATLVSSQLVSMPRIFTARPRARAGRRTGHSRRRSAASCQAAASRSCNAAATSSAISRVSRPRRPRACAARSAARPCRKRRAAPPPAPRGPARAGRRSRRSGRRRRRRGRGRRPRSGSRGPAVGRGDQGRRALEQEHDVPPRGEFGHQRETAGHDLAGVEAG